MSTAEHVIEPFETYKVKNGDTLESLAARVGLRWQALARLNFGTDDPVEVNRCLRAQVGCTKKTRGGNYVFTDQDDPGILLLPKPPIELVLETGKSHRIVVMRPDPVGWIEVETVDESGHRLPEVSLRSSSTVARARPPSSRPMRMATRRCVSRRGDTAYGSRRQRRSSTRHPRFPT